MRAKRPTQQSAPKKTFSKVVPINPTSSSRIKIMRPSDINDSTNVANEIKEGRLVIFDVGQIDNERKSQTCIRGYFCCRSEKY